MGVVAVSMGFIAMFSFTESTGIQTCLLNFSDQTKDTAHDVADCHLTRLGSDQALTNLAHSLDQRTGISCLRSSDDTEQQLGSRNSTRSRISDLASLQQTFMLSDELFFVMRIDVLTYEMKCSIEVSTSACLRDFRKEDNPGVAAMVVDIMIVHQVVVAQEFAK